MKEAEFERLRQIYSKLKDVWSKPEYMDLAIPKEMADFRGFLWKIHKEKKENKNENKIVPLK